MRTLLLALLILVVSSPAGADPKLLWAEAPAPDGVSVYTEQAEWVRFRGAWYRAERGLERSTDGVTWTAVAGAPRAHRIATTSGVLFATQLRKLWRSDDGEHWTEAAGDLPFMPRIQGDAKLLLAASGDSKEFRCSTDRGATWRKPGKGWVNAPSVYGVNVVDGEAWVGFHTHKEIVSTYSGDRCKTWRILARGRYVTRAAKGVLVESDLEKTEVTFDGRKTWVKSPVVASDTTRTLLQLATDRGVLVSSKENTWFITTDGPRSVPMDGLTGIDLDNAVATAVDGYVYIRGSRRGDARFFRAAIAELAALPK
jgi:hypothetical protein